MRLLSTKSVFPALAMLAAAGLAPGGAWASSHREAPLIIEDPAADNTDLYAFTSPGVADTVTILANYIPMQGPAGGPNWQRFSDGVLYEISIDNTGDAKPDIIYQFRFRTDYNPALARGTNGTFFYNIGQITGLPTRANFNGASVAQAYSVTRVDVAANGTRTPAILNAEVPVPPPYVGRYAFGTANAPATDDSRYNTLANSAITTLSSGERVFAGPRDDPFFADLGAIFDDATFRGAMFGSRGGGIDYVGGFNTHTIAIQVPVARLVQAGTPTTITDPRNVIGIYASASRPRVRVARNTTGTEGHGQFVQVSRLGIPLVNEVLIPVGDKDRFNATNPADDAANYGASILIPSLPTYAQALYGATGIRAAAGYVAPARSATDANNDMLQLVTGKLVPGGAAGFAPADLLRLNVRTPASALPTNVGNPTLTGGASRLGAAGADANGFPNGRRLFDDVVDIELRYVLNSLANINAIPFGDGVDGNDKVYSATFPYIPSPAPGSEAQTPYRLEPAR